MPARFKPVSGVDELNEVIEQSNEDTVVLFNHDPWCPISARALHQMEAVDREIAMVDVSRERSVTREIASRTGVRHESPQVIVVRNGDVIWSASHWDIVTDAVERATSTIE